MKSTVYITGKAELSQVECGKQDASSCEDPGKVLFYLLGYVFYR